MQEFLLVNMIEMRMCMVLKIDHVHFNMIKYILSVEKGEEVREFVSYKEIHECTI